MNENIIKILMVEDNPDHAYISERCLQKAGGFFVKIVPSFEKCRQYLLNEHFDIILLDYDLPNEDGLTILKRLIKDKNTKVPIVVVTGHGHEQLAVEALKTGALDYVVKTNEYPTMLPNVVTRVMTQYRISMEKRRMQRELRKRNKELRVLNVISEVVNQSLVLEEILKGAIEKVTQVLELEAGAIFLIDELSNVLELKAHRGLDPEILNLLQHKEHNTYEFTDYIQFHEHSTFINDLSKSSTKMSTTLVENNINSLISVPLKYKNNILGALVLGSKRKDVFSTRHVKLLSSISNQISIAIENAKLYLQTEKLNEFKENIIDSSLDLIVTLNYDGTLRFFNKRFEEIYEYSTAEIRGKKFLEFIPEHRKAFIKAKFKEVKHGQSSTYEAEMIKANGGIMPCLISQSPLKGEEEFLMVIKDISNIVNLQKQLIQSEKLSALGQMISGVAHELNNPLAGILGYSQLILEEKLSEPFRRDIEVISKEAVRCTNIVKNLLTFARKYRFQRQLIKINAILESVLELLTYQLQVDSIEVVKEFNDALPSITGDFHQLQQVFLNLINNAHQALNLVDKIKKQIIIKTELYEDIIRVKIFDNGIGISSKDKPRLFDPFFTTKEVGQGTGLGLSICYGIVQSHNGNLYLESEIGEGSTFIVELPVIVDYEMQDEDKEIPNNVQHLSVNLDKEPKQILVIDDEEVIIDLIERILVKEGLKVKGVANGEEALQVIKKNHYDLVICDIKMPQMDGENFYKKIKEVEPELAKRLIFTTGDVISPETQTFLKESTQLYLSKPFKAQELLDIIRNYNLPTKS